MDPLALALAVGVSAAYSAAFFHLQNRKPGKKGTERWAWIKAIPTIGVGVAIGLKGAMEGDVVDMDFIFTTLPLYAAEIVTVDQILVRLGLYERLREALSKA